MNSEEVARSIDVGVDAGNVFRVGENSIGLSPDKAFVSKNAPERQPVPVHVPTPGKKPSRDAVRLPVSCSDTLKIANFVKSASNVPLTTSVQVLPPPIQGAW
jgi:hypothetical protein